MVVGFAAMKTTLIALLALCLCLAGCGKKEPNETANELFVEAIELVSKAKSEETPISLRLSKVMRKHWLRFVKL